MGGYYLLAFDGLEGGPEAPNGTGVEMGLGLFQGEQGTAQGVELLREHRRRECLEEEDDGQALRPGPVLRQGERGSRWTADVDLGA